MPAPLALALSLASGLLLFASNEPVAAAPVGWVALAPLFVAALRTRRPRSAAAYGFVTGAVYFGAHLVWILNFGWMAWTGLVAVMSLYYAVAAGLVRFFGRFPLAPVLAASSWAGMELVRDGLPFGGFGWGALGNSQGTMPGVRWLAGAIGTSGLTFLLAFAAALVADRVTTGTIAWPSLCLVGAGLAAFVAADVAKYGSPPPGHALRVAVVQGSVPRPARPDQDQLVFESHLRLSRGIQADIVVWPESTTGSGTGDDAGARLAALARALDTDMLVGRTEKRHRDEQFLNLVDHIDPSGGTVDTYQKRRPVPFGEYVPLPFLRRYVSTLGRVPYDMVPGRDAVVFHAGGARVATPICFESAFARDVRAFVRAGAELVVVATNNSSFERSFASSQHLMHSRMRALETRQWVVQAAISGISAVVAPDGTISHQTGLFQQAVFLADVRARPARSLYVRVGDLFVHGWMAGTALALLLYAFALAWGAWGAERAERRSIR